ncbi:MAG: S8 family serine peptidase [Planctomycetes bacterium]|nr:S8 family serine peptidase [Planctomycetota bacterium]
MVCLLLAAATVGAWAFWPPADAPVPTSAAPAVASAREVAVKDSVRGEHAKYFDANAKRAFFETLPASAQDGVVKLKDRWLLPLPKQDFTQTGGREQVYLQVTRWLKDDEKKALEAQGCRFGGPFTGKSYRALLEPGAWDRIKDNPLVAGAAPVLDEDKLHQPLFRMVKGSAQAPSDPVMAGRAVKVAVEWMPGAVAKPAALLAGLAQNPVLAERNGSSILRLAPHEIARLAALPEVAYLSFIDYIPHTLDYDLRQVRRVSTPPGIQNEVAQGVHNVTPLHQNPYNLFGNGINIAEIDGGKVRTTHEALTPRVTLVDTNEPGPGSFDNHATHVCGTMIADPTGSIPGAGAQGMAPQAKVFSYNFDPGLNGIGTAEPEDKAANAVDFNACITNNNSWGYVGGSEFSGTVVYPTDIFGDYDDIAAAWDQMVIDKKLVVCKAAGNDRNDIADPDTYPYPPPPDPLLFTFNYNGHDGQFFSTPDMPEMISEYYFCISNWGCSKNITTVGAIDSSKNITIFSSTGPANDGRVKPDVVADGLSLKSTWGTGDTDYQQDSGTSMASPVTTGITALLLEAYKKKFGNFPDDPLVIKGLLIHTAEHIGPNPGPNYVYGFGSVDAQAAVDFINLGAGIQQGSVSNLGTKEYKVTLPSNFPVKVTLLWLDAPGTIGNQPDIVNDLDLELEDPAGVVHFPFGLDVNKPPAAATSAGPNKVDTVEQVIASSPLAGEWSIRIKGTSVPSITQSFVLLGGAFTPALSPPTMTAPSNPTYNLKPVFSWTMVTGAELYEIKVDDLTTNTLGIISKADILAGFVNSYTSPISLTIAHNYRAKVRARTIAGSTGTWSNDLLFTVQQLATPTVTAPLGTVNVTQPTLSWTAITGAETYDVVVSLVGGGTVYSTTGVSSNSLLIPIALTPGKTYQTVVTAKNSSGNVSAASAPGVFTISNNAFVNQPINGGGGGGSTGGGSGGGNNNSRRNQQPPNVFGPQQQPKKNKNPAAADQLTNNKADQLTATLNMPVPAAPLDEIAEVRPSFEWSAVQGADFYELMVVDVSEEGVVRQVLLVPDLTDTKYKPKDPLPAGRKYRFLVRAYKKDGSSSQVAPLDFSLAASAK